VALLPAIVSVALLVLVLVVATLRPQGLTEAAAAVPVAVVVVAAGLLPAGAALTEIGELGPTVGFLAAILLLGHLADVDGVFDWLGDRLATTATAAPVRLLGLVFAVAAATTVVLSLDATVVLLTPVVLATTRKLAVPARPHVFACAHLANSASLLLPVSNLTNLLAFAASGLTFLGFAALMALPWLAVIIVEYLVARLVFARDLVAVEPASAPPAAPAGNPSANHSRPAPRVALTVLALTLAGFAVSSPLGIEPVWVAAAGAVVLAVRELVRHRIGVVGIVRATNPLFCLFVLALGVVVAAVSANGLTDGLRMLLPAPGAASDLFTLLAVAGVAALLANMVNNLPATLVLLDVLAPTAGGSAPVGLVLAVLLGVNIGPNLTYVGSLATLLWRRVLTDRGAPPAVRDFLRLGALTVPLGLGAATVALWAGLRLGL
jgi:arsenical pump membrane protein